jgi:hypothetical protein
VAATGGVEQHIGPLMLRRLRGRVAARRRCNGSPYGTGTSSTRWRHRDRPRSRPPRSHRALSWAESGRGRVGSKLRWCPAPAQEERSDNANRAGV